MKRKIKHFLYDIVVYHKLWGRFLFSKAYRVFSVFETIKRLIAKLLYRQRGRFARPFVHTAMVGLMAVAVMLAPILANTFPGVGQSQIEVEAQELTLNELSEVDLTTEISDKVRDKAIEYKVQSGDTVSTIAQKFGISTDTIRWENDLSSINQIKPGQTLRILPVSGVKHKVTRGETIYSIAKKYNTTPQGIVDFPFNTFADNTNFALSVGQELMVPEGEKPAEVRWSPPSTSNVARNTPNAGAVSATGQFVWPIGGRITQGYKAYHRGIDIATAHGTPVLAADSGTVITAGWPDRSGYGMRVIIDHGNEYRTLYAHLSKTLVSEGQTVTRGNPIGLEGSTGRSTGPHLHFEIFKNGVKLNPFDFLK